MGVTVIQDCADHDQQPLTGPSTVGFAWNGRIWAGKILYESQKMDKSPVRRMQRDNHMEDVKRKRGSACAAEKGTAWKTGGAKRDQTPLFVMSVGGFVLRK